MVVMTPRQSMVDKKNRETPAVRLDSRKTAWWKAPCDEHGDQVGPCVHANLPEAEQVRGWYAREDNHQPREDPRALKVDRIRTHETSSASRQLRSTTRRQRPTTYAFNQLDEALRYTRSTSVAANSSAPTLAARSLLLFRHRQPPSDGWVRRKIPLQNL